MKKSYLIFVFLLFTACTPISKQLVEVGGEASCVKFEVQDQNGETIDLPESVKQSLDCITGAVQISPDSRYLLYDLDFELYLYDFYDKSSKLIYKFEETTEGISCIWHKSGIKIACATIDQQNYEGNTKIILIDIEKGIIQEFPQIYEKMLDFVCGASCYPGDFWFEGENSIKYNGHNIIAPGEVFEIRY